MTRSTDRAEGFDLGKGAERGKERASDPLVEEQQRRRGVAMAGKFVGRFSQLDIADLREPVERWRRTVALASTHWFNAESAIATAVRATGRHAEQESLVEQLVRAMHGAGWLRRTDAIEIVGASEASVQYTATLAMLALLLHDRLTTREFTLLYSPFAPIIPVEELGPE